MDITQQQLELADWMRLIDEAEADPTDPDTRFSLQLATRAWSTLAALRR